MQPLEDIFAVSLAGEQSQVVREGIPDAHFCGIKRNQRSELLQGGSRSLAG